MSAPIDGIIGIPKNAGIAGITNPIQKIASPVQAGEEDKAVGLDEVKESSFGSLFTDLIQNVRDTDAEFTQAQYLLATGQLDNPAEVTIANTKAAAAVDLLIQLRNKAVDAYSELMRISL